MWQKKSNSQQSTYYPAPVRIRPACKREKKIRQKS
eukprot:UN07538